MASRWLHTVQAVVLTCTSTLAVTAAAEPARAAVPTRVYVATPDAHLLTVLDPAAADPLVAQIPLGGRPRGVTLSPDGARVHVPLEGNLVAEVDTRVRKLVKWFAVPDRLTTSVALSPGGQHMYVTHRPDGASDSDLVRISTVDGTITGRWPLKYSDDCAQVLSQVTGPRIFVSCYDGTLTHLYNVDPGTGTVVRADSMDQIVDTAVSRDGTRVFAIDFATWHLYAIDAESTETVGSYKQSHPATAPEMPNGIATGAQNEDVYQVVQGPPGAVRKWNTDVGLYQTVNVNDQPATYADVQFFDGRVYVTDPDLDRVVASGYPVRHLPVPAGVDGGWDYDLLAAGPAPTPAPPGNTKIALEAAAGGYTLTATNVDATDAATLRLTLLLSGVPVRVVAARPSHGRCLLAGDRFSCEAARIPPGGTVRVAVSIRTGGTGRLTATADVIGVGPERNTLDNRAVVSTWIR